MMREAIRPLVCAVLCGLLVACGGTEADPVLSEQETLGTQSSELCSGLYVTSLVVSGASTYNGEMAASGTWTTAPGANAVRLEYYVGDTLYTTEERVGTTGTWYFSTTGIACGPRNLVVKAWPMVVDSAGNRTTCSAALTSTTVTVTEDCHWTTYAPFPCGTFGFPSCYAFAPCPSSPSGQVCSPYGSVCIVRAGIGSMLYYCI
ncbi:MAG TPA: hypothetical protein VFZ09_37090 [Archangium sp.]|uniref:hypothetical protein n=1 Tax=Archangium sp. TaxID=1872627 RepID=UPI002E328ED4|nr:hypothetical protein [Archangium sp.]HEX5751896.1 hypothetical protein [Archangium sp.]